MQVCVFFSAIYTYSIKNQIKHVTKNSSSYLPEVTTFDIFGAHFVFVGFCVCVCVCVLHFCLFWEGWYLTSISLNDIHIFFLNFRYLLLTTEV